MSGKLAQTNGSAAIPSKLAITAVVAERRLWQVLYSISIVWYALARPIPYPCHRYIIISSSQLARVVNKKGAYTHLSVAL